MLFTFPLNNALIIAQILLHFTTTLYHKETDIAALDSNALVSEKGIKLINTN